MCNINEIENLVRIEKKIDQVINYTLQTKNYDDFKYFSNKEQKSRQLDNRKAINKILYALPQLKKFAELKEISKNEVEYLTNNYIEALMGAKNVEKMVEYSLFKNDIQEKIRTKIFIERVESILDSYLNKKADEKINPSKKAGENNIDSLNIKKAILRRLYGYKLQEGETKLKSREEFAEVMKYSPRSIYIYQNELLDDLAPSFFGVNGLIL